MIYVLLRKDVVSFGMMAPKDVFILIVEFVVDHVPTRCYTCSGKVHIESD